MNFPPFYFFSRACAIVCRLGFMDGFLENELTSRSGIVPECFFAARLHSGQIFNLIVRIDLVNDQTGNELGIEVSRFLRHFLAT